MMEEKRNLIDKKINSLHYSFILINIVLGASVLSLPYIIKSVGIIGFIILVIFSVMINYYSSFLLVL